MLHPSTTATQNRPPSTFNGSVAIYALTEAGCKQAKTMHRLLPSTLFLSSRFASAEEYNIFEPRKIGELIAENWQNFDGHIFIMATGIVLRKIAPLLQGKTRDPAVVTCDELGQYAVSLLGGHIGGANRLAEELAKKMDGQSVITTGIDAQSVIAFDDLAQRYHWDIVNPEMVKELNSLLLQRKPIGIALPHHVKTEAYPRRDHIVWIDDLTTLPENLEALVTLDPAFDLPLPTLKMKRSKPTPNTDTHRTISEENPMSKQIKSLCLLGTGSDVGKSVIVAALCRIFKNRGLSVAPYKAQNMSNNSFVTLEGGEMGRAQVVQAEACKIEPHTDMNPVLLKPNTDIGSQIVLQGHAIGNCKASEYFKSTTAIFSKANESLARLQNKYDLVIIEGAGSCAEVNLRDRDFVNFETAHAADAPVIIIADIDRGGVFAQIIGSLAVIPERDRKRVAGFIINKFRGDPTLFDDGIAYLEEKTGLPVLGLIPYYRHIEIDPEDGLPLETVIDPQTRPLPGKINIAAIRLPHISNFTDFNPLIRDAAVSFHYLSKPRPLDGYNALILPGSKNVRFDLQWLKDNGWDEPIQAFAASGGRVLGVCGGYQMLGKQIHDPHGAEGEPGSTAGFGLLDIETTLESNKVLSRSQGKLADGTFIDGYEIHMGRTDLGPNAAPLTNVSCRNQETVTDTDGAVSPDGLIIGSYFHGLFDFPDFRNHFLAQIDPAYPCTDARAAAEFKQTQYDLLATHFEQHLDMPTLEKILKIK